MPKIKLKRMNKRVNKRVIKRVIVKRPKVDFNLQSPSP